MNIPFIDLKTQYQKIESRVRARIDKVLSHGAYVMGPEVGELEQKLSEYVNTDYALACSSGTDALILALMALNIGPGDAVITTPFTFFATAETIAFLGATPVFVDIDPTTYNLSAQELKKAIRAIKDNDPTLHPLPSNIDPSSLTLKAIIAVDLFGLPCDYDQITDIARQENLKIIEDAAQSFGATYKGRQACSFGDISCTSFFPAKPLGCYGDGGMCFTNDQDIIESLRSLRIHGQGKDKYENIRIGINGRLDTLQAAILLTKLEIFPQEVKLREQVARRYNQLFEQLPELVTPKVPEDRTSVWAQYSLLAQHNHQRDKILAYLKENNIPTAIYYPKPLHLQKAFDYLGYKLGDFKVSENIGERIFSLPMHPYLEPDIQEKIFGLVKEALEL
ncbi:DegT/DnrJ/EryC1/StrS family aminotransferase [Desulfovulcanus sp.]